MRYKCISFNILFLLLSFGTIYSQHNDYEEQIKKIRSEYMEANGDNAILYSGKTQALYPAGMKGHPYYRSAQYIPSTIYYNGIQYDSIPVRLDIMSNELIILTPTGNYGIVLQPSALDSVTMHDYSILYAGNNTVIPFNEAYYVQLYKGRFEVIEKMDGKIEKSIVGSVMVYTFDKRSRYYVVREGEYLPIKNTNALIKLFPGYKKEIKQLIRDKNLSFKEEPRAFLIEIIKMCEKI